MLVVGGITLGMIALLVGLAKLGADGGTGDKPQTLTTEVGVSDHVRGPVNAPVTLVEYSDYQCPACQKFESTVQRLTSDFDKELRIIYRNFPLTGIHKNALAAAYAAEAAELQGRFWEYHDILFNTQDKWSQEADPTALFLEYAKTLSLNTERFATDMKSDAVKQKVAADMKSGEEANVNSTPSFFLNGTAFKIPDTYEGFNAAIVEQLILTGNNNVATSTK